MLLWNAIYLIYSGSHLVFNCISSLLTLSSVHLELVERIIPILPSRIARHRDFVRSGAFYPDAFYNCRGQYDVAEDAHWPPFLASGVDLVLERKKEGRDTSQLEAFLIGILSHQVSDVSWHSLGLFQGLLKAMATSEFDGDYDEAHSVLDVGGDMIQLSRRTDKRKKDAKWNYDVEDIVELVTRAGYPNIPQSSIHYCMARGQAAYTGELQVADVVHKTYSRKSPTMFNELESYFIGGLTDMHEQVEECLPELIRWMDSGVDKKNYYDICPVFGGKRNRTSEYDDEVEVPEIHFHKLPDNLYAQVLEDVAQKLDPESLIDGQPDIYVDSESPQELMKRDTISGFMLEILKDSVPEVKKKLTGANSIINGGNSLLQVESLNCKIIPAPEVAQKDTIAELFYPWFGKSLTFWGDRNLVVGSPAENKVYIYETSNDLREPKLTIESPHPAKSWGYLSTHFGTSMTVWEDEYLVVGSPGISMLDIYDKKGNWVGGFTWENATLSYGSSGQKMIGETLASSPYSGMLYVGAPRSDFNKTIEQSGVVYALPKDIITEAIQSHETIVLELDEHVLCSGKEPYQHVGLSLKLSPRGIFIGSPGTEEVWRFTRDSDSPIELYRGENIQGDKLNALRPSRFGGSLVAANEEYTIVGAPAGTDSELPYKSEDQEGVIIVFTKNEKYILGVNEEFAWFGAQGVIAGDSLMVVSPHAAGGHGMLWKVNLKDHSIQELGVPHGSFASGFGASLASNGKYLAVGMPHLELELQQRHGGIALIDVA